MRKHSSASILLLLTMASGPRSHAADCNQNGVEDSTEVDSGAVPDCNRNGRPDSCDLAPTAGILEPMASAPEALAGASMLALADVNGDGRLDALVGNETAWEVQVHLGDLSGFAAGTVAIAPEPGRPIFALAANDFTGDGLADVAFIRAGPESTLELSRSTGDGFAPPESLPGPGQRTYALLAEDLDNDGSREIIEASYTEIRIHWNDAGAFGEPTVLKHYLTSYFLLVLDVEGDGDLDLLAAIDHLRSAILFRNGAQRVFQASERHELPVLPRRLVAGDLDGTPGSDLLALESGGALVVLTFDAGEFRVSSRLGIREPMTDLLAAELDGDGLADAIVFHGGSPCGTESSWIEVRRSSDDLLPRGRSASVPGPARAAAPGDLDGDGDVDVAVLVGPDSGAVRLIRLANGSSPLSRDINADGIPDECDESDCNWNGSPDRLDVARGTSPDCDGDLVPDECEPDCDANGEPDDCDVLRDEEGDLDGNGVPDTCESRPGDCNLNGIADALDIGSGLGDCDDDGQPDVCETHPEILLAVNYVERVGLRSRPGSAVAADLDGDGDLDAAFGSHATCCGESPTGGSVEVLLNSGKGRLVEAGVHDLHGDPIQISAGDFERDGDLDLLVLEASSPCRPEARATWLLNRGRGSFDRGPRAILPPGAGALVAGDLDGKNDLDIAVASPVEKGGCALILLSDGAGSFSGGEAGPPGGALAVSLGDWNEDGVADLAASSALRNAVFVLPGEGGGRFAPGTEIDIEGGMVTDLTPADVDGDGDLDLLAVGAEPLSTPARLTLLAGDGTGKFAAVSSLYLDVRPSALVVQDVDGDRKLEVFAFQPVFIGEYGSKRGGLRAFRMDAGLPFEGWNGFPAYIGVNLPIAVGGDWDEDGLNDLLVADAGQRTVAVLRNSGAGSRFFTADHVRAGDEALDLAAADLDGDGDPDLVAIDALANQLWVGRNDGGTIIEGPSLANFFNARALSAGDIDGDGDADLAIARPFEVLLLESTGKGSFAEPRTLRLGSSPIDVTLADLDGDGDLDIATANDLGSDDFNDNASVFRNTGRGEFEAPRNYGTGRESLAIEAADMDGDGDTDLLAYDGEGGVLLRNAGDGTFSRAERVSNVFSFAPAVTGDVDGDGDRDILANSEGVFLVRNRGDGVMLEPEMVRPFSRRVIELADMDVDGDLDLLFLEGYGEHWLQLLRNDGRGAFAEPVIFDAGQAFEPAPEASGGGGSGSSPAASVIVPADFDGDGDLDLALGFTARRWITIAWNGTRAAERDSDRDGMPDSCGAPGSRFRRGDVDGSGVLQITDAVRLLQSLFVTGEALPCEKSADADDDGKLNITDALRILGRLFLGDVPLPPPHPDCGLDPSADDLACTGVPSCL